MIKKYLVPCLLIFLIGFQAEAQISISSARSMAIGATVSIKGIVTNGSELGVIRYIQDNTAGIAAYSPSMSAVQAGDSILITGVLKSYNQLLELDPVNSFQVLNSNNPLPNPQVLSISSGFAEQYEGMLVKFNSVTITGSGNFAGSTNYPIIQGVSNGEIRVNSGTNLVGTAIPSGQVNISGIMSQFSFSSPSTGYQLLPRSVADINTGGGPIISSSLNQDNIQTTSFDLSFDTQNPGSTIIFYGENPAMDSTPIVDNNLQTQHLSNLTNLKPATIYYARAASVDNLGDTSFTAQGVFATASNSSGVIKAYFTRTVDHSVAQMTQANYANNAVDDTLIRYINRAKNTIDIAIYNWNNNGISDISTALNNAFARGVKIRVITDGSTATLGLNTLNLQIPRVHSPTSSAFGIMHNKFVIFDCDDADANVPLIWTGSTNWTQGNINVDANNVVIVQDQSLARTYKLEFEEMWGSSTLTPNAANARFGPNKRNNTPHLFNVNGKKIELFFSPSDDVENQIIRSIESADADIEFATNFMTRNSYAYAIRNRIQNANVYAGGIIEDINISGPYNILDAIPEMDSTLFVDNITGLMHHKYVIVDQNNIHSDPLVSTGSHNWSASANNDNDENTIIIHDYDIANQFFQEWLMRFKIQGGTKYVTGLEKLAQNPNIQVSKPFPNPSSEKINLEILAQNAQNIEIKLLNVNGQNVYQKEFQIGTTKETLEISIQNFAKGFYFLEISGTDFRLVEKVILR